VKPLTHVFSIKRTPRRESPGSIFITETRFLAKARFKAQKRSKKTKERKIGYKFSAEN
jgi:hypothetical protein